MPPRLRKVVNAVRFNSSSSEGDDGSADDAAWTPAVEEDENAAAAAEAADAEAGGVGAAPKAAAKAAAAAPPYCLPAPPRPQLTPEALSSLLLALPLAAPCRLAACDATAAWVRAGGLRSPAVVPAGFAAELGFRLPASLGGGDAGGCSGGRPAPPRSARDLAPALLDALGPDFPVPVVDVGSQQEVEHGMRLGDFLRYFTEVKHKQLLNVVSLSLAGTQLDGPVAAPSVVRDVDLVAASWPEERNDTAPAVQLYALLSPAGCYTDWHLDFGGSSVWYAIAAGRKAFAVAPPSDRNLSAFFRWASSSKQAREFLGASLHDAAVVTVGEGEVLLLPGGWPHAVVTPADTLAFGGNFLHTANCGLQCTVARMEEKLGVKPTSRFPQFRALCWYAARAMCDRLPPAPGEEAKAARDAQRRLNSRLAIKPLQQPHAAADGDDTAAAAAAAEVAVTDNGGAEAAPLHGAKQRPSEAAAAARAAALLVVVGGGGSEDEDDDDDDDAGGGTAAEEGDTGDEPSVDGGAATAVATPGDDGQLRARPHGQGGANGAGGADTAAGGGAAPAPRVNGGADAHPTNGFDAAVASADGAAAATAGAPPVPPPLACLSAPRGPPLTPAEATEAGLLAAQLRAWLLGARHVEKDAGVPASFAPAPRVLLSLLKSRLVAAGVATPSGVVDAFTDAPGAQVPRLVVVRRERDAGAAAGDEEPLCGPLPDELRDDLRGDDDDDDEEEGGGGRRKKVRGGGAPKRAPAPPPSVRDRLAKKLKSLKRR